MRHDFPHPSRVGTLPRKTAEDESSSGENDLLWSNLHRGEPQTPDFGFVVVTPPRHYVANPVRTRYHHREFFATGDDFDEDGVEQNRRGRRRLGGELYVRIFWGTSITTYFKKNHVELVLRIFQS